MKLAALILGILGGVLGLFGSVFVLGFGGVGAALEAEGANQVIGLGWSAFAFSLLGIISGGIAIAKPKIAGILLIISAIGGTVSVEFGFIIAGPLLFIAGILALLGSRQAQGISVQHT